MKHPEKNEYVLVKITKIIPYGSFCELLEYPGYTGFIHISETSTAWVKNIRSHVKENQVRVAKVLSVSPEKKTADLSLKRVSGGIEKRKLEEMRRKKRGEGLLKVVARKVGKNPDEIAEVLEKEFGDVLGAFEEVVFEGDHVIKELKIPEEWKDAIISVAKKYIEIPKKEIKVVMEIIVPGPKGVSVIRNALKKAVKEVSSDGDVRVYTAGAPKYIAEITTPNYKKSEKLVEKLKNIVKTEVEKCKGKFEVIS